MHVPNTTTGTGYRVAEGVAVTRETLEKGFGHSPDWASTRDRGTVRKWKGIEEFRKANSFNAGYTLVAKGA